MKRYKILFTAEADDKYLEQLYELCDVQEEGWKKTGLVLQEDELIALLEDKDILVTSYDVITNKIMEASKNLKLIVCTRSNPVNVDVEAAKKLGIKVAYTPGRNSDATAEFAVGLLLDIARNITFANRAIMNGDIITDDLCRPNVVKSDVTWGKVKETRPYFKYQGIQIKNKTIGIVGYGSIGKRVAKILEGFGANILVYDPYISRIDIDSPSMKKVNFDELLTRSDFISCHIKITESTTGLFNCQAFKKMKKTAFFINNSRGAIAVEDDLVKALKEKEIAGAALDVFEYEPLYKGHPFLSGEIENLLLTPHISGAAKDSIINHTIMLVDEIKRFINGENLIFVK
jgi:D-3-phosphoglycerate dehydrogenase / 2-oxoglutarate reductase